MCVGKTNSEITKTCTSACKNFSRCSARIAALNEAYADTTPLCAHFDDKLPAITTRARSHPLVYSS